MTQLDRNCCACFDCENAYFKVDDKGLVWNDVLFKWTTSRVPCRLQIGGFICDDCAKLFIDNNLLEYIN